MDLPREDSIRFLVARYAQLRAAHRDAIGEPDLLEPSGRHFPDEFVGDGESVGRLVRRMISYAPLADDLPVDVVVTRPEMKQTGGGCGSGACGPGGEGGGGSSHGRVVELEDRYRVELSQNEISHPVLLAAALARSIGGLVLAEAGEEDDGDEAGPMSEIAATATGFGLLLMGGSALYAKGCGGLRMHRVTHLSVEELAVALAVFVKLHAKKPSQARAHLETTQREAFDEAMRWADSNEAIIARLRDVPESLEGGIFDIEPTRGLFGRFFQKRKPEDAPSDLAPPASARRTRSPAEERRIAETKALVEEALRGT